MRDQSTPLAAKSRLTATLCSIWRHGPDETTKTFLCMGTLLGDGVVATVEDRGVYGSNPYGKHWGTRQLIDLFVHVGDKEIPVRCGTMTAVRPIAMLKIDHEAKTPPIAGMADMAAREYAHIHRATLGGGSVFSDLDFDASKKTPTFVSGFVLRPPYMTHFRCPSDENYEVKTICVEANMGYPGKKDVGAPIVDDLGRLAGVHVGSDIGGGGGQDGTYVPADIIMPVKALFLSFVAQSRGGGSHTLLGIDRVEHYANDVF